MVERTKLWYFKSYPSGKINHGILIEAMIML